MKRQYHHLEKRTNVLFDVPDVFLKEYPLVTLPEVWTTKKRSMTLKTIGLSRTYQNLRLAFPKELERLIIIVHCR